jgi:hypothetical protein
VHKSSIRKQKKVNRNPEQVASSNLIKANPLLTLISLLRNLLCTKVDMVFPRTRRPLQVEDVHELSDICLAMGNSLITVLSNILKENSEEIEFDRQTPA